MLRIELDITLMPVPLFKFGGFTIQRHSSSNLNVGFVQRDYIIYISPYEIISFLSCKSFTIITRNLPFAPLTSPLQVFSYPAEGYMLRDENRIPWETISS